jgi:gliding motility-associated-like protein
MKKLQLIVALFMLSFHIHAQIFEVADSVQVSFKGESQGKVVDMNNDGSMDYLLIGSANDRIKAIFIDLATHAIDTLQLENLGSLDFELADMDNNNRLDIIAQVVEKGDTTIQIFYQTDSLKFSVGERVATDLSIVLQAKDLNLDGRKEIVYSRRNGQIITKTKDNNGDWINYTDPINTFANVQWLMYDADNDGYQELLTNGKNESGAIDSKYYQWKDSVWSATDSAFNAVESFNYSYADFNNDGLFDLSEIGLDNSGKFVIAINQKEELTILDSLVIDKVQTFSADFNSDGLADLMVIGQTEMLVPFNTIYLNDGSGVFVKTDLGITDTIAQLQVSDMDYDGDLDLIVLVDNGLSKSISVYENSTSVKNFGPTAPPEHIAFVKGHQAVIVWAPSSDDFTDSLSLTYDVFIGSSIHKSENVTANFDLESKYRLFASRGNSGLRTEFDFKSDSTGIFTYGIQPIDNALYYLGDGGGEFTYGQFVICEENNVVEILTPCMNEELQLITGQPAGYLSKMKGYLGITDTLNYVVTGIDTLYSTVPNSTDCGDYKTIIITPVEIDLIQPDVLTSCIGNDVSIRLEAKVDSVKWFNASGLVSTDSTYAFTVSQNETINIEAYLNSCLFQDTVKVIVSESNLNIENTSYAINKGESVQLLVAVDGFDEFDWTPKTGLDNPNIASPIASPAQTTVYTLNATDSIGCSDWVEVTVNVTSTAWVPDLFTPNNDGNNDLLLIYGLSDIAQIKFEIFTRSGNEIYSLTQISELKRQGWNGKHNGADQPNGLYYWKVTGQYQNGNEIKLNGKSEGVIYLMR